MKEYFSVLRSAPLFRGRFRGRAGGDAHLPRRAGGALSEGRVSAARRGRGRVDRPCLAGSVLVLQEDIWGNRNILSKAGPGQTYAAAYACAPGAALNVSVAAETAVTVTNLNVRRVLNVCPSACAHHSRIIRNLLGELAAKNLQMNEKLTHMAQRTTREKLLSYLSAQAQRSGSYEFDLPFSRQQQADYLAVERSGLPPSWASSATRACSNSAAVTSA